MKIHYFQRYHQAENVATANTMLLLSRLYSFSPDKFFHFFKTSIFPDGFEPEIVFNIQERNKKSIPDAIISQDSFKIVVETKLSDWFYSDQLMRHLLSFGKENVQVLMTLAPVLMEEEKKASFDQKLAAYNGEHGCHIVHLNTTFQLICQGISGVLDERDYEMHDILEDFSDYCYSSHLIVEPDSWKFMRAQLAGTTIGFNSTTGVYYDNADRGFRPHDYLGLYNNKSVRFIGKINAIAVARIDQNNKLFVKAEKGTIGEEQKALIMRAIEDGRKNCGYSMEGLLRYFFVDEFIKTNFKKSSLYPPRGSRIFNLAAIIGDDVEQMSVSQIAEQLRNHTWE